MSFSDESELSELSSEEEYQVTKGKGKKKAKKSDPEKSLIRGALKAPRATTYSAQALYGMVGNEIVFYSFLLCHLTYCRCYNQCGYQSRRGVPAW